jgi:uncharacterized protein
MRQISNETARRYLLGRLGLWPGRRWVGKEGAAAAARTLGAVQIDPLNVAGRNHDLVLWSRVVDYEPAYLDALLYQDRAFFDYGGLLFIYPMEELPYWRLHMRRRAATGREAALATERAALIEEVRAELRARGPLGNRDFKGNARVESYRARKDTGLALWYLWITGELMTHGRRNFERIYGFRDEIAPPHDVPDEAAAEAYFARKALEGGGLVTATMWAQTFSYYVYRRVPRTEARRWLDALVDQGVAVRIEVGGAREPYLLPAADLPLLGELARGEVPEEWRPVESTTDEEVSFLAPLDNLLHRQRTKAIFDFEYIWEVYKPAAQRRWGYYTLPVLWRDRLVARIDPKLDRKTATLAINGFWVEDDAIVDDPAFASAFARGLSRFARFLGARCVAVPGIETSSLRRYLETAR